MKAIDNVKKRLQKVIDKTDIKVSADNPVVRKLCEYGEDIIREAYATKDTKNRLYNQHDAYGYAVYYDGTLIGGTKGYLGSQKSTAPAEIDGESVRGRDAVNRFLDSYSAPKGRRLTLLVVNAMSYSQEQEMGLAPMRRKYRILSQVSTTLNSISAELKGKVEMINLE